VALINNPKGEKRMKTRKLLFHLLSLLVFTSLLAACGGAAPTQAPASSGNALYDAAKAEGMLTTIALPHDWCNYGGMMEGFKAKYPGITINELDPGAGSAEELEAIKANKDNPGLRLRM
jgi:putative spermidine/putrescine transport system substrate-binding protein